MMELRAHMAAILKANAFAAQEVMKMGYLHPALEEALREYGYIAKWDAETGESNSLNIARNMIGLGLPLETVVSTTELDPEKVRKPYASDGVPA